MISPALWVNLAEGKNFTGHRVRPYVPKAAPAAFLAAGEGSSKVSVLDTLKSAFQPAGGGDKGKGFTIKLLVLLAVGAGLMLFSSLCSFREEARPPAVEPTRELPAGEEESVIRELTAMLEQIRGVGKVRLFLTYETLGRLELVIDQDRTLRRTVEEDGAGGSREIFEETVRESHVVLRDSQGRENPLVIQENRPRYRGVLVVAEGVENPAVRARVVEALRAALDLPYHRITVLPR